MSSGEVAVRLAVKVNDRQWPQALYTGKNGDVAYEHFMGVNLIPTAMEVFLVPRAVVERRSNAQHQRGVSRSFSTTTEPSMVLPWDVVGTTFFDVSAKRTVALKKAVIRLLQPLFGFTFV